MVELCQDNCQNLSGKMLWLLSVLSKRPKKDRGIRPKMFQKKSELKDFTKFIQKKLMNSWFYLNHNPQLNWKRIQSRVFCDEFCKIFENTVVSQNSQNLLKAIKEQRYSADVSENSWSEKISQNSSQRNCDAVLF